MVVSSVLLVVGVVPQVSSHTVFTIIPESLARSLPNFNINRRTDT